MGWFTRAPARGVGPIGGPRLSRRIAGVRVDVTFAVVDGVIVALSYLTALVIRFIDRQGIVEASWWDGFWLYLPVVVVIHLLANALLGAYGHVWEYASIEEAMRLVVAVLLAAMALLGGLVVVQRMDGAAMRLIPLTVVLIGSGVALGGMGAVRFRSRLFSFRRSNCGEGARTALVVGTGRAAADLARRGGSETPPTIVLGFVGNNPDDRQLAGVDVLGGIDELPQLIATYRPDDVVMAASIGPEAIRRVVDLCMDVDVGLRTLPDAGSHSGSMGDVRDLELSDLLPRATVTTDLSSVGRIIAGRRVLVTGAGGSIGSEIVRQVAAFDPSTIIALDHDEGHLYEASLGWAGLEISPVPILADICDRRGLQRVVASQRPQVVFHAAAHKHVPILEMFPQEAVKTNVVGTANMITFSRSAGVERFVLISTDKAVEPASVMGASKRVAEMLVQSAPSHNDGTIFTAVRFGNVLGSRGSVVPTFMRQIKEGGPVTVSDPEMLRYFMLTSEAVELVLQAAAMAEGREIFVLDMGQPVRIGDLAHRMVRLAGLVPGRDIEVKVVGPRPGEKTVEMVSNRPLQPSRHPQIGIAAHSHPGPATMLDLVNVLRSMAESGNGHSLRSLLMAVAWREWSGRERVDLRALTDDVVDASA